MQMHKIYLNRPYLFFLPDPFKGQRCVKGVSSDGDEAGKVRPGPGIGGEGG